MICFVIKMISFKIRKKKKWYFLQIKLLNLNNLRINCFFLFQQQPKNTFNSRPTNILFTDPQKF